ncbi:MAG TPA: TraR/DksA family transcriptional regulator [bacterium]|nr:TraR/DksA family transcriptional regulator [bacterium]
MAPRAPRSAKRKPALRRGAQLTPARRQKSARTKANGPARVVDRPRGEVPKARALTKKELGEFRRLLEEERTRLLEELEAIEEHTPEVEDQVGMDVGGGYDEDLADVASNTFEREKGLALESSVQAMLAQVEEALGRIDDGSYGQCQRCGDPIDIARLRVLPFATLCIRCKELEEKANGVR